MRLTFEFSKNFRRSSSPAPYGMFPMYALNGGTVGTRLVSISLGRDAFGAVGRITSFNSSLNFGTGSSDHKRWVRFTTIKVHRYSPFRSSSSIASAQLTTFLSNPSGTLFVPRKADRANFVPFLLLLFDFLPVSMSKEREGMARGSVDGIQSVGFVSRGRTVLKAGHMRCRLLFTYTSAIRFTSG